MGQISPQKSSMTFKQWELYILDKKRQRYRPLQYIFNVNVALRLNLSFEFIYFSAYSIDRCYFGRLEINSSSQKNLHNYCGIYANESFFPSIRDIIITIHIAQHMHYDWFKLLTLGKSLSPLFEFVPYPVYHNMSLVFSIIDRWRIHNTNVPSGSAFVWQVCLIPAKTYLQIFHLKVNHFKVIRIHFLGEGQMTSKVFDGPGLKYPLIKPCLLDKCLVQDYKLHCGSSPSPLKLISLQTSSFQCVIHHFVMQESMSITHASHSVVTQTIMQNIQRNVTVTFPFPQCFKTEVCVWHIVTYNNSFLKFGIEKINNVGHDDSDCQYGGFAVYETSHFLLQTNVRSKGTRKRMRTLSSTEIYIQKQILAI